MCYKHVIKSTNISIHQYIQALSRLFNTWVLALLFFVRIPTLNHVFILTSHKTTPLSSVLYAHLWTAVTFQIELCKWTLWELQQIVHLI